MPSIRVAPLPGKGLGTVATRCINRGEIIIAERPLVKRDEDVRTGQTHEYSGGNREDALNKLLTLCQASKGKDAVERVLKANSFVVQEGAYTRFPVRWTRLAFLNISRVNHSCSPNAEFMYHAADATATVKALKPIAPGDEVCINYGAEGALSERQDFLSRSFEFDCRCERCVQEMGQQKHQMKPRVEIHFSAGSRRNR